eukprot:TRINITY_DN13326_c0_g1_i1.p1 TRINITY_DN13326_c0_g1~~TRINITY_DN13326_c0_g1_i1.p1  ORF type:complete len:186 (+),score=17.91 TRINITY_DN13326_c0_g1_i1:95-652(+)
MDETEEQTLLNAAFGQYPSDAVLAKYSHVPVVNRNRLHYPILKCTPELTGIVFLKCVLQHYSGCCSVSELLKVLPEGSGRAVVFHIAAVLHRDLWVKLLVKNLGSCMGVVSLTQDAVDFLTLSHPVKDVFPIRSVTASENFWRDVVEGSSEPRLKPLDVWLHWDAISPRYHMWWMRQMAAGRGVD